MESPLKQHKYLSNIDGINEIAYNTLFTKYIIENLRAEQKLLEIDSTDQESIMRKLNGGYPLPGFIYTFIYPPSKKDENVKIVDGKKIKEYIDYVPLVFCISAEKDSFKGINLNTLPKPERVKFLETYYIGYKKFFKNLEELTENDKLAINMAYITAASSKDGQQLVKLFDQIAQANFNYGFRHYKLERIRQFRMIEYCEWNYIPFYDPRSAFKLMNQKQIHDLYYKTLR